MAFNKVILIGNMTADPELKQTTAGTSVCSFSIAVNRRFKSESGQQEVDFINIVAWRQSAEFVSRYFKKGQAILVCGQLQARSWNDNQGNKRTTYEVVADEVAFAGNSTNTAAEQAPTAVPPNPAQWGKGNQGYTPDAYKQQSMAFTTQASQSFEEIPNDEDFPF